MLPQLKGSTDEVPGQSAQVPPLGGMYPTWPQGPMSAGELAHTLKSPKSGSQKPGLPF